MEIDLYCVVPDEQLFPRIRENCKHYPARARRVEPHDGAAVLVAGGPSLRDYLGSVRKRREHGQAIFALNGACKYLNENGIIPDYQVLLDPQSFMVDYIGEADHYLVASQCDPSVLAALPNPILWHVATEGAEENTPHHPDGDCLVGGGYTVGLCAMCLVYALGYRNLHLFGYDSSSTDEGDHAYKCPIKGTNQAFDAPQVVTATVGGKTFKTTLSLAKQAQVFPKLCDDLIDNGCLITVECDGLLRAVVDNVRNQHAAKAA